MTNEEFAEQVRLHSLWFRKDPAGRRLEVEGVTLRGIVLRDARITGARLVTVDLCGADLQGTWFTDSELFDVSFNEARLSGAEFAECRIRQTNFDRAKMDEVSLAGSRVTASTFQGAHLTGSNLAKSTFEHVQMADARLAHSHLARWEVMGSDLRRCDLRGTNWRAAKIHDCDLRDADLTDANLSQTLLQRVKLSNTHGMPFLAELAGEGLDFSPHGDGSQPGTLDRLRVQLGGGTGPGRSRYGLGTTPALYRAHETIEGERRGFVIVRRADDEDVFRIEGIHVEGDTLFVDYEQVDPRFPGWLAADLISDVLLLEFLRDKYRGNVYATEYRNKTTGAVHISEYGQHEPPAKARGTG